MARRKLVWSRLPFAITSLEAVSAITGGSIEVQDLLQGFRTEAGITRGPVGLTVMRIRMSLSFDITSLAADPTAQNVRAIGGLYYGIRVYDFAELASEEVLGIVNRGPMIEPHLDWMAWGRVPVKQVGNPTATAGTITIIGWADVDVRAMRKVDELGQTLGLVIQTTSGQIAASVGAIGVATSVLLALP